MFIHPFNKSYKTQVIAGVKICPQLFVILQTNATKNISPMVEVNIKIASLSRQKPQPEGTTK